MTATKVQELIERAARADLDGLDFLVAFSDDELAAGYNGIGPEFLPERIREKTTRHLALFEPAALVHDMRNEVSDGSRAAFAAANAEFLANCLKLANAAYPWFSWRRWRARAVAHLLFDFVQGQPGWIAWRECFAKNQRKENTMKKTVLPGLACLIAALAVVVTGCLAIKVEDYGREVVRDKDGNPVLDSTGAVQTVHKGQRWHYNKNMVEQSAEELDFTRKPGDDISFSVKNYRDVVSAELNKVVETSFKGAAELAAKIGAAIATSGGSIAGEAAKSALSQSISNYIAKGGDAANTTVTCKDGTCTFTDGNVTETCESCIDIAK